MGVLQRLFSRSPFEAFCEHSEKVHECVQLVSPIVEALLEGDQHRLRALQDLMSKTEHEADVLKADIRGKLARSHFLPVARQDLARYLAYQDDIADAAEDFAVVASLRATRVHPDLRDDLRALAEQVVLVSEKLLDLARLLARVARASFTGSEAETILRGTDELGEEEWRADRLQRAFARHSYSLEEILDPVTLVFYDKICSTLSAIANKAENTGKFLHMMVVHG